MMTLASAVTSLAAWILAALNSLPLAHADRAPELEQAKREQYEALAVNIAQVSERAPRYKREWAALMVTLIKFESAGELAIHRGQCRVFQCDPRRLKDGSIEFTSRSLFQMKRNGLDDESWARLNGVENTAFQVREASKRLARGMWFCSRSAPWPSSAIRGYAGGGIGMCTRPIRGEAARIATYRKLVAK
jgi:hypothetical protein